MKYRDYLSLELANECLLKLVKAPNSFDTVTIVNALGRVAYEDVHAHINQPPFDRSAVDGYAVNHEDIEFAGKKCPAVLQLTQNIFAGDAPAAGLLPNQAARIMTGAPLPSGADCVVRQEDCDCNEDQVRIFFSNKKFENVCFKGEDVHQSQLLLKRGQRIDSAIIGVLAGQGLEQIKVFPMPKVGILSTGSELAEPGCPLPPGKIYDSNSAFLAARVQSMVCLSLVEGSVEDDPKCLVNALKKLMTHCDFVITTGGVSVGAHDYMTKVGEMMDARLLFHGVDMKPGSPVLALEKNGKLILCLSGNPFAATATFELLAIPVLQKLSGCSEVLPKRLNAILRKEFNKPSPGRRFIRAQMLGGDVFLPDNHASGNLSSLAGCNCLIDIPSGSPALCVGTDVEVVMFQ